MEPAEFWSLIDEARASRRPSSALEQLLARTSAKTIVAFQSWFQTYHRALRREDLWAAVYTIRGGCGDDSFDYFRSWLIGQGEQAVVAAVHDPESLADCVGNTEPTDEELGAAPHNAYKKLFGVAIPDDNVVREIPRGSRWPADRITERREWTNAFLSTQFPRLWARYAAPRAAARGTVVVGALDHARFWSIIDDARGSRAPSSFYEMAPILTATLRSLSQIELSGFDRWLHAYSRALMRNDLRGACRILFGTDDPDMFGGLRGCLLASGERVVQTALTDPDSLAGTQATPAIWMLSIAQTVGRWSLERLDEADPIPVTGATDWPEQVAAYTPELLRARLPRLSADRSDTALAGPVDPDALPTGVREERAGELVARAKDVDDATALRLLDDAVALSPRTALFHRGRIHARLGNSETAIADLDAAIRNNPDAAGARFERAKLLVTCGRRDQALTDARHAAALGITDAQRWLDEHSRVGPPKRVRHAKFGDGTVVAIEGGDKQTLVIDFPDGRKKLTARFVEILE